MNEFLEIKEKDIIYEDDKELKLEDLSELNNEFNINSTSLMLFPPVINTYIQISPDNKFIAFLHKNKLEIYTKENFEWKKKVFEQEIIYFEKCRIKGMNWSEDNKMLLIYGDNSEFNLNKDVKEKIKKYKALIKAIALHDPSWSCEIEFNGIINHSSFYPDSMNIVYIKSLVNILNILSLSKEGNKKRNVYYYLKFDDERSINYIKNDKNIWMIIPCYGRRKIDKDNIITGAGIEPSDYIIILVDQKPFQCFKSITKNLDKIIPFNNDYSSFFIVVEKEFYKNPFYIYNLHGQLIFKSVIDNNILTNPCLLYNKEKKINFIVAQAKRGKLEILGCQSIFNKSEFFFFYEYNKLYENKKILSEISKNKNFFINKNDILFLEEKIDERKKQNFRELIKTEPFNVDICYNEKDYLLHSEISPNKNFICFINNKYPKYLFFSTYYQIGVFKIIKFCKDITCFKWSTQKDILLVTIDDSIFYIITKDHYLSYNIGENCHFNSIEWSPLGKEVILSNEEKKLLIILQ